MSDNGLPHYEITVLINPNVEKPVQLVEEAAKKSDCSIMSIRYDGLNKSEYAITKGGEDYHEAHYVSGTLETTHIHKMSRELENDENVLRFLVVTQVD